MRQSQFFAPTLRNVKSDNEGHALLLRGGYIRQLGAGIYSYLPLGLRVLRRIEAVVRDEMNRAGAIEILMPALHPLELWQETGRDAMDVLFRLQDQKGAELVLGPTHEEVVTDIVRASVSSYKQLPVTLYQIQTKFRDEPRPRAGLLRGREFSMKDAYSFDANIAGLDKSFDAMVEAYKNVFTRCGLEFQIVDASGGGIGGFDTKEFMVPSPAGEDVMLFNASDGYAANLELATSTLEAVSDRDDIAGELEKFATPGVLTIENLTHFAGGADAVHQIKTLVYVADEKPILVLLRGDHQLNEAKLSGALSATNLRAATGEEIYALLGAHAGSLGAVGVADVPIVADETLRGRTKMTTGANEDGFHLRGVNIARDIAVTKLGRCARGARGRKVSPRGGGEIGERQVHRIGPRFQAGQQILQSDGRRVFGRWPEKTNLRDGLLRHRRVPNCGDGCRNPSRRARPDLARRHRALRRSSAALGARRRRDSGRRAALRATAKRGLGRAVRRPRKSAPAPSSPTPICSAFRFGSWPGAPPKRAATSRCARGRPKMPKPSRQRMLWGECARCGAKCWAHPSPGFSKLCTDLDSPGDHFRMGDRHSVSEPIKVV